METIDHHEPDNGPRPEGLRGVSILHEIYLAAGLAGEDALRSALADYTHHFLPAEEQCAA